MEQLVRQHFLWIKKDYGQDLIVPPGEEQFFLLGNRWADYGLCLVFALAFPLLRKVLTASVYEPVGRYVLFGESSKRTPGQAKQERLRKWIESCWKMTVYIVFTSIALLVSFGEPWFLDTRYYWAGCSHFPPCNMSVSKGMLLFYTVETGFYLQAIHFLVVHETRRKDWLESMIHHIATSFLLAYSYYLNFSRVGIMVLLVHDVSDIFLEAAKLARYARKQSLAVILFTIFTTVWIVTRNVIFPYNIIRSTLTETLFYADLNNIQVEPHYSILNGLLLLLLVLHIYWTYLILKIVWKQLTQGEAKDIREQDDSDDEDEKSD